jgi:hypothetical protein
VQDLVYLARDLGAAGVDLDYEEMWHGAPMARVGVGLGVGGGGGGQMDAVLAWCVYLPPVPCHSAGALALTHPPHPFPAPAPASSSSSAFAADYFKEGPASGGPWTLPQTVFKYAAIAYDIQTCIKAIQPGTPPFDAPPPRSAPHHGTRATMRMSPFPSL